jgi:hypothetical protein
MGDTTYKSLQEKGKIDINFNFQWMQSKKTYGERKICRTWEDGSSLFI